MLCHRFTQAEYRLEVAMYQLISLERCSRFATVESEENEREPYDRKVPQAPQADHWPRTAEELPLKQRRELVRHRNKQKRFVAEVSIEDPSSSLASPESFHLKHATDFPLFTPPAFIVGDC